MLDFFFGNFDDFKFNVFQNKKSWDDLWPKVAPERIRNGKNAIGRSCGDIIDVGVIIHGEGMRLVWEGTLMAPLNISTSIPSLLIVSYSRSGDFDSSITVIFLFCLFYNFFVFFFFFSFVLTLHRQHSVPLDISLSPSVNNR